MTRAVQLVASVVFLAVCVSHNPHVQAADAGNERAFLTDVRQLVFEGRRAGEGYFSPDGAKMVFQSERESDNPFYQIYVLDLETGDTVRVSPGSGKTSCGWLHPDGKRVMFASTHEDPKTAAKAKAEFDMRAAGKSRRYKFEYDPEFEEYQANADGSGGYVNLTNAYGYDAEGSYSPDGTQIAFASNRHAYSGNLSGEDRKRLEIAPEYFADIYIMDSDGGNVRRLTDARGYDGGPFFSPDGGRICWRRFNEEGNLAEIWTMNLDGSDAKQITKLGAMSWAPFYHPSGDYLIFNTNLNGFGNFELYLVDVAGKKDPVRVTYTDRFDGLPAFLPDGKRLSWTSQRTADGDAQIFLGNWNDAEARKRLGIVSAGSTPRALACMPDLELPATTDKVSASDLTAHAETMAKAGSHEHVVDYVAAVFCKLGLAPAGERATMFQFCEIPKRPGSGATQRIGCNVLARLRAKGKKAGSDAVIIGAHLATADGMDRVYGIAGMLEIAEYLAGLDRAGKLGLKRDIIFAAFVGDPISAGFVADGLGMTMKPEPGAAPPVVAYIGLDAIDGLGGGAVRLTGVGSSPVWAREIERRNAPVGLRIEAERAPDPATTGFQFYAAGVPALSIAAAASDAQESSGRDAVGAARISRLAGLMVRGLATASENPAFTPILEHQGATAGRPYLGTEPDYIGGGPGVKLTGVAEGGPAQKAGVRAGDTVVELAGKPIEDIRAYAAALDELKVNQETTIVVLRDGKRITLKITPQVRN